MTAPAPAGPWRLPELHGDADRVRTSATLASGLLAGFSVTAILTLLTTSSPPPLAEWAVVAFALAAATSLVTLNYQWWAQGFWSLPSSFLEWRPTSRVDYWSLLETVSVQRDDAALFGKLVRRARTLLICSVAFFLAAVALTLTPQSWSSLSLPRVLALASIVLGLLLFLGTWATPSGSALGRLRTKWLLHPDFLVVPGARGSLELTDAQIDAVAATPESAAAMKAQRDGTEESPGEGTGNGVQGLNGGRE